MCRELRVTISKICGMFRMVLVFLKNKFDDVGDYNECALSIIKLYSFFAIRIGIVGKCNRRAKCFVCGKHTIACNDIFFFFFFFSPLNHNVASGNYYFVAATTTAADNFLHMPLESLLLLLLLLLLWPSLFYSFVQLKWLNGYVIRKRH